MNSVSFGRSPKIITTDDDKQYKKVNPAKTAGAMVAGGVSGYGAMVGILKASQIPAKKALMDTSSMHNAPYKNIIDTVLEKSGLSKIGVKIFDATKENSGAILNDIQQSIPKKLQGTPLADRMNVMFEKITQMTIDGKNAFFNPKTNNIVVSKDKMAFAAFHEMGHAINKNLSFVGKALQKTRKPGMMLAYLAFATAMFKRKKVEGEQPKNKVDKATSFIKNNATGLAALGALPTVLEEGLASLRASKLTKGLLSAADHKAMNIFHGKALLTYVGMAAALTTATFVAGKVRDGLTKPKEIKQA